MINKIKNTLNKISVGKIFIAGLLMLPMILIFPENIICKYMYLIGCFITLTILALRFPLFFILGSLNDKYIEEEITSIPEKKTKPKRSHRQINKVSRLNRKKERAQVKKRTNKKHLTRADLIPDPALIKPLKKLTDKEVKEALSKKVSEMKNIYDF